MKRSIRFISVLHPVLSTGKEKKKRPPKKREKREKRQKNNKMEAALRSNSWCFHTWLTYFLIMHNLQACFYSHPGGPTHEILLPGTHFLSTLCPVGTLKSIDLFLFLLSIISLLLRKNKLLR